MARIADTRISDAIQLLTEGAYRLCEANLLENALSVFQQVLDIAACFACTDPENIEWQQSYARCQTKVGGVLATLGRLNDALTPIGDVVARFGAATEPILRECVAVSLTNKGIALGAMGRHEEAIAAFDDLLAHVGTATEPLLRELVARALVCKGVALDAMGRREEAIATYDDLLARFGTAAEPLLREGVARALFNKRVALGEIGRRDEAIAVCDDLLARFGTAIEPLLRWLVARSLLGKGTTLREMGRHEEAIAACNDLLARFDTANDPPLRELVARALAHKRFVLAEMGRREEAIAACNDLLARFSSANELPLRELVATALVNKGFALGAIGRDEEEIAAYDDLLGRFGTATELSLCSLVARALSNRGVALAEMDRREEALAAWNDLLARFGTANELPLRELVARALVNKGSTLGTMGRYVEAIVSCDDLLARLGTATEPSLREKVAMALVNKGVALSAIGCEEEAQAAYRQADTISTTIRGFAESDEPVTTLASAQMRPTEAVDERNTAVEGGRLAEIISLHDHRKYFKSSGVIPPANALRTLSNIQIDTYSYSDIYHNIMNDADEAIKAAADHFGLPVEVARKALEAARAAREMTSRAEEDSFAEKLSLLEREATARGDSTLFGLLRRYAQTRASIHLPPSGLTREQAQAAAGLSSTYGNLQARLRMLGLEPLPRDPLVAEARRLSSAFYRKERRPQQSVNDADSQHLPRSQPAKQSASRHRVPRPPTASP